MMFELQSIESFIKYLQEATEAEGKIAHLEHIPPKKADYRDFQPFLTKPLSEALRRVGIEKLYSHQVEAIGLIKKGENVLIPTPTASGKTLIYNICVFEAILEDQSAGALYIFPTKALTQDQLKTIREFGNAFSKGFPKAEIYDGDTSAYKRTKIKRDPPNILLTNPDMLHLGILAYHSSWEKFLSNLKFVVLDELHTYRGIFGCHVSHILRRLRRICKFYGSNPQFISSSATISNGEEFAKKLTGLDFKVIAESGAPQGPRYFLFWNPGEHSPYGDGAFLLNECIQSGLKTIAFTQARRITELITRWVVENNPGLSGRLSSYRAGYLPEERREIEKKLFSDELDGVIATSALELGIDVGGLDCCILVGYPGSIISTWQRGGRAGRGEKPSLIILVALPDALDRFFMRHPQDFFSRGFESITIDEHNFQISCEELPCAASEIPLSKEDGEFYGGIEGTLSKLCEDGKLLPGEDGTEWFCPEKYPQRKVSIRSMEESYAIIDEETEEVIGDVSSNRVFYECHPGAIYLHRGEEYEVAGLDNELKNVYVRKAFVNYYTQVTSSETTSILKINSTKKLGSFLISWGEVEVKRQVVCYEKRRVWGGGLISEHKLNLPAQSFVTTSVWMELPKYAFKRMALEGGLHAIEHASIALFPLLTMCDRWDVGGTSATSHPETKGPVIFIYDGYPGGVGLAERAYKVIDELLEATLELIQNCPCEEGCPSCIQSPKCGSRNQPLNKHAAIAILRGVLEMDVGAGSRLATGHSRVRQSDSQIDAKSPSGLPTRRSGTGKADSQNGEKSSTRSSEPCTKSPMSSAHVRDSRQQTESSRKGSERVVDVPASRRQGKSSGGGGERIPEGTERIIYFDLETQKSAEEVGGWDNKRLMRVSVAVVYDSLEGRHKAFTEDGTGELIQELLSADLVIGFNVKHFDWEVLKAYSDVDFSRIKTLDLLEEVFRVLGRRLSLDHLARATLKESKIADGLQAIEWFREGNIEKLTEYCKHDVDLTRRLHEFGKQEGYLLFEHYQERKVRIPVNWR